MGCSTVAIACVRGSEIGQVADVVIEPVTGPEVLTGSTRLKAGTAQKMVLNMISTGSMVRMGKAYQNLMVDVRQSNEKLRMRARRIVMEATGCTAERAAQALADADGEAKVYHRHGAAKHLMRAGRAGAWPRAWQGADRARKSIGGDAAWT